MAGSNAISATGKSIERLLTASFDEAPIPVPGKTTRAVLIRTDDLDKSAVTGAIQPPALSIFLYRVDFNKTMRSAWSGVSMQDGRSHLPLDLHFLLTAWADNAEFEHAILGRAIQCLDSIPILSGPLLLQFGEWATNEGLQLVMEESSTDSLMRLFDSLPADYRLSVPYIARIIRLDGRRAAPAPDVSTAAVGMVPS
jgi:hypothetical protein